MNSTAKTPSRGISANKARVWAQSIEKEDRLRLNWFRKNVDRLEEIAHKANQRQVPDEVKLEMQQRLVNSLQKQAPPCDKIDENSPFIPEDAVHNIMKPVEKAVKDLLYKSRDKDGRILYLHERIKLIPEDRYYFPETTSFQYGWNMWNLAKENHESKFARQQVIKASFYRRRGTKPDPKWYKAPAVLSPQVCGCI